MSAKVICFSCNRDVPVLSVVGRREECPFCRADLHVCKNCAHYDAKSYNECKEPQADRVQEKDRANFCDYFTPGAGHLSAANKTQDLKAAAEALFKKK